ncbi:MAG: ParB/Srx family N-terminal domain-containing protein [Firmicutes bacterium]|nr:ParB/Srx family N-terminal domain-containing protein [Bacillota bacterium]
MADNLKIEYIKVEKLTPYEDNSKIHTKEQIRHIANSIKEFGFNDPLGIAGSNNVVLEGNGRIEAVKLLGITELPCIRLDHLTDDERRAYVIAHNATNLETGFDDAKLLTELEKLQKSYDLKNFGLDTEKFFVTLDKLQEQVLKPYRRVHYLISLDINDNDKMLDILEAVKKIGGVEIESTTN